MLTLTECLTSIEAREKDLNKYLDIYIECVCACVYIYIYIYIYIYTHISRAEGFHNSNFLIVDQRDIQLPSLSCNIAVCLRSMVILPVFIER